MRSVKLYLNVFDDNVMIYMVKYVLSCMDLLNSLYVRYDDMRCYVTMIYNKICMDLLNSLYVFMIYMIYNKYFCHNDYHLIKKVKLVNRVVPPS